MAVRSITTLILHRLWPKASLKKFHKLVQLAHNYDYLEKEKKGQREGDRARMKYDRSVSCYVLFVQHRGILAGRKENQLH